MRKRAQRSTEDYLLGGKKLPWYMLGLSNASGMFDISGTMWLVAITFVYGLKSIWIPWLWPVFNQVFLMVYLSAWLRRSNVLTGAEWITFRFGSDKGAKLSHTVVVIFAIVSCLGFLAYGFIGLGKFVEIFIPWETVQPYLGFSVSPEYVPHFYGIVFTLFSVFYSIMGGMGGIVWADVLQYTIMTVSAIVIAYIAWDALNIYPLNVPEGWHSPLFGWELGLDWKAIIPEINQKITDDGFSLFTVFFMLMIFKGILASLAGPAPNYDMQKILSTKSPKEAAKMSGFVSLALNPSRYLMIGGFAVLGLLFYEKLDLKTAQGIDFENILPAAISEFVPVGLTGLLLAGLLAAFMSTFAGTLNAAQAYIVNDIVLARNKNLSQKKVRNLNYGSGVIVVLVSIILGFFVKDVNSVLQWIVSALWGGYVASNILKWHWWKFNGYGYFWGMLSGLVPAILLPVLFPDTLELYLFPLLLIFTVFGCFFGNRMGKPTDIEVLKNFYVKTRPWGRWGPIKKILEQDNHPLTVHKHPIKRDVINIITGTTAQTLLVLLPLYLVLHNYQALGIVLLLLALSGYLLKKYWWDTLDEQN